MRIRIPRGAPFIKIDRGGPRRRPEPDWGTIIVCAVIVAVIIIALLT